MSIISWFGLKFILLIRLHGGDNWSGGAHRIKIPTWHWSPACRPWVPTPPVAPGIKPAERQEGRLDDYIQVVEKLLLQLAAL